MKVEWYSGYTRYDQPRRLLWGGNRIEVRAVLARGTLPQGAYLKILASDRRTYRLDYVRDRDAWEVTALG